MKYNKDKAVLALIADIDEQIKMHVSLVPHPSSQYHARDRTELRVMANRVKDIVQRNIILNVLDYKNKLASLEATRARYIKSRNIYQLEAESGVMEAKTTDLLVSNTDTQETMLDIMGGDKTEVDSGSSRNTQTGQDGTLSIQEFFRRPVIIHSAAHAVGSSVSIRIKPWDLLSLQPAIRAKFKNFAYFRGDLRVRISVSGTPFHYGRLLASYQPYASFNDVLLANLADAGVSSTYRPHLLNYLSQSQGSTLININQNKPAEMHIPFISTKPMHRLFNKQTTILLDTESFDDFKYAGDLFIYSINDVAAVSTGDTPIYIQVYAWFENVELGVPSGTNMEITAESGLKDSDERKTGPVETITTKMLQAGKYLVPLTGFHPYALASQAALKGINAAAAALGWSKPITADYPRRVIVRPTDNLSAAIGTATYDKIALDPTQETSIDPRIVGVDYDELLITTIAGRPTYLETVSWESENIPLSDTIAVFSVTPNIGTYVDNGTYAKVQPSTMAFCALPFHFWRGDITFRFEIVCSNFHRGKIAIVYEPNANQIGLIANNYVINKQFIRILDIQDTNTIDITVNWASARAWLKVGELDDVPINIGNPLLTTKGTEFINGFLMLTPFTQLQSPDGSPVAINVYAYSDNLQLAGPTARSLPTSRYSTTWVAESGYKSSIPPGPVSEILLNPSTATTSNICLDHFGEHVPSFRLLLKRWVKAKSDSTVDTTANSRNILLYPIFPESLVPVGTTGSKRMQNMFDYLRYSFLGSRGAIRVRFSLQNAAVNATISSYTPPRVGLAEPSTTQASSATISTFGDYEGARLEGSSWVHITCSPQSGNSILDNAVEYPYYSNNLFQLSIKDSLDDGLSSLNMMEHSWFRRYYVEFVPSSTNTNILTMTEVAAGEDFQFLRFLGTTFYTYSTV